MKQVSSYMVWAGYVGGFKVDKVKQEIQTTIPFEPHNMQEYWVAVEWHGKDHRTGKRNTMVWHEGRWTQRRNGRLG